MTENVIQSLQKLIQDVIAPDVRELKVEVASLRRETAQRLSSLEKQSEARYKDILAAIAESHAHGEVVWQEIASLRERIAMLEAAQAI